MATTTSITTTYAGEFANKIIAAALLSSPTIDRGGIEVKPLNSPALAVTPSQMFVSFFAATLAAT